MEIYLITDTHFNHKKMVKYCGRPENFDDLIWQSLENLPSDCMLIHLGDICIGKDVEVHERIAKLPYKKMLIKGNHDKKSNAWYLNHGWDDVAQAITGHYFGKYITFSHIPVKDIQNINIHGHYHNNLPRLLAKKWVVEGEKERNDKDFPLEKYNENIYKLLAIENTDYKAVLLEDFILNKPRFIEGHNGSGV